MAALGPSPADIDKMDSFYESDCDTRSILSEFSVISGEDATALDQEEVEAPTQSSQYFEQTTDDKTTDEKTTDEETVEEQTTEEQTTEEQTTEEQDFEDLSSDFSEEDLSWGNEEKADSKHRVRNRLVHRLNDMLDTLSRPFDFEDSEEFSDMLNDFLALLQELWVETKMNKAGEDQIKEREDQIEEREHQIRERKNQIKKLERRLKIEKDANIDLLPIIERLRYENNRYHQERIQFFNEIRVLRTDLQQEKDRNSKMKEMEAPLRSRITELDQYCQRLIQESQVKETRHRNLERDFNKAQLEKEEMQRQSDASQSELSMRYGQVARRERALIKEKLELSVEILACNNVLKKKQADLEDETSQRKAQDEKHQDAMQKLLGEQAHLRQQQAQINTKAYGTLEEESHKVKVQLQEIQLSMDKEREEHEAARSAYAQQTRKLQEQTVAFQQHIDELESQMRSNDQWFTEQSKKTQAAEQAYVKQIDELKVQVYVGKKVAEKQSLAKQDFDNVLTATKEELEKLHEILEEAQDENVTLKNRLQENSEQLNEKTQRMILENGEMAAMRVQLENEKCARQRLMIELGQITRDYKCLKTSSSAAEEQVKAITVEKESLTAEMNKTSTSAAEEQVKSLTGEKESLIAEKKKLAEDLEVWRHVSVTQDESYTRQEARLSELMIENNDLESSRQILRQNFEQLVLNNTKTIVSLEQQIRSLNHHRVNHITQIKTLEIELADLKEENEKSTKMASNKYEDLQREMDMRMQVWADFEVSTQKENDTYEREIKDLKTEITSKNDQIDALGDKIASLDDEIEEAHKLNNSLQEEMDARTEVWEDIEVTLMNERDAAWKEVKDQTALVAEIASLKAEKDEAISVANDCNSYRQLNAAEVQQKSEAYEKKITSLETELTAKKAQISTHEAEVKRMNSVLKECTEQYNGIREQANEYKHSTGIEVEKMRSTERDSKRKIADLTTQNNARASQIIDLKTQSSAFASHINDLTAQVTSQKEEITKLEAKIDEMEKIMTRYRDFLKQLSDKTLGDV